LEWDEHFSVDAILDPQSFDELKREMDGSPDLSAIITIKLDGMQGLYTTWSPSISEGRVLKFLDRREDVANVEEMPEEFKGVGFSDRLPFSIYVTKLKSESSEENE
jgi:hypothetical protein